MTNVRKISKDGNAVVCKCAAAYPKTDKKCPSCGAVNDADTFIKWTSCNKCRTEYPDFRKKCPCCGKKNEKVVKKPFIEQVKRAVEGIKNFFAGIFFLACLCFVVWGIMYLIFTGYKASKPYAGIIETKGRTTNGVTWHFSPDKKVEGEEYYKFHALKEGHSAIGCKLLDRKGFTIATISRTTDRRFPKDVVSKDIAKWTVEVECAN